MSNSVIRQEFEATAESFLYRGNKPEILTVNDALASANDANIGIQSRGVERNRDGRDWGGVYAVSECGRGTRSHFDVVSNGGWWRNNRRHAADRLCIWGARRRDVDIGTRGKVLSFGKHDSFRSADI